MTTTLLLASFDALNACYLKAAKDHVNFGFFQGGALKDPKGLLEGTGKAMRHVKLMTKKDFKAAAFRALVREAVAACS